MRGVFKSIAGAFVEMDDKPVPKVEKAPRTRDVQAAVITVNPPVMTMTSPDFEKFRDQFKAILEDENKRNYPGNDYYEFTVMKNAMSAIPQEELRYQAAFAGWRVGGNQTKESLISTAKIYLGLVDKEIKDFEHAYKTQYDQQVLKNEQVIEQKTKRVQELVEEMNKLNAEIQQLKGENFNNTASLTAKHDAFMAAGGAQREEILLELEKINQYIS